MGIDSTRGAAETQAGQRRRVTNVHATQKGRLGDSSKGERKRLNRQLESERTLRRI